MRPEEAGTAVGGEVRSRKARWLVVLAAVSAIGALAGCGGLSPRPSSRAGCTTSSDLLLRCATPQDAEALAGFHVLVPGSLPAGLRLNDVLVERSPAGEAREVQLSYRNGGRWLLLVEERSGRGVTLAGAHPAALGGVKGALAVNRMGVRSFTWGGRFVVNWQGLADAEVSQIVGSLR